MRARAADGGSRIAAGGEIVLVTGASTGIGAATARQLAGRGYHVLAGVRRTKDGEALRAANIEPIRLDITDESHVASAVARIDGDPQRRPLRALVNNAGIAVNAPVETLPIPQWRRLFDVNLFGQVAMIQGLMPALLRSHGTIVNVSSVGGKVAMSTYGPYAGSKFALEAVSDALRREIAPLGVKVVVIEPAAVRTPMLDRVAGRGDEILAAMTFDQQRRYGALLRAIVAQADASALKGISAEAAAEVIAHAVISHRPRARYTVGRNAAAVVYLARLLPDWLLDRLLARLLDPYRESAAPLSAPGSAA